MIEKKKTSLLLMGTAGLLIVGGAAAYWILTHRHGLSGDMPVGANIIPQDAIVAVSMSTEPRQWQQLREFGTKQTQSELDKNLAQVSDRFLTANGYNYQQDIQPWVGDKVTIAFLSPERNTSATNKKQSLVMVLPIKNLVAAKQILEKPKPLKQGKWIDRNYKGVQIKETEGVPAQNYSAAVLEQRFLVITDNPKATDKAIDTYNNGGASLATTAGYTEAFGKIAASQPFAQLYINVPAAARVATANPGRAVSPQGLAQLRHHQGIATNMSLEPDGIRFKTISWLKPNSPHVHVVENKAGKMQRRLPAETLMMVSGGNLQQLWQDYVQAVKSNPLTLVPPQNLRAGVKSLTGLDLDEDLFSWMDGEFSLSVIPATPKAGLPNDFALSLVFMVQASDRDRAEQSLEKLDRAIASQYQFKLEETQVGGQPVVNWIAPYGTPTATHGWLDGDIAFLSLGAVQADSVLPKPATTLASTEQFQKTVPSELSPHNGQFFLDVEPTIKALPLPQFFPNQQMLLEAMRTIGVTTAVSDQRSIRYDIFVALKKAEETDSLPSPGSSLGLPATPQVSPSSSP